MILDVTLELKEVLSILLNTSNVQLERLSGGKYKACNNLSQNLKTMLENAYGYDFTDSTDEALSTLPFYEWDAEANSWKAKENFNKILDFVFRQYGDSYCLNVPDLESETLKKYAIMFMDSFLDISVANFQKYDAIFNLYDRENNLMRGVKYTAKDTSSSLATNNGTNGGTSFSKFKDTPQSEVTLEDLGDDYNSNVNINQNTGETHNTTTGSNTLNRTAEDERETPIDRLKAIQDKYMRVLNSWANEYQELFWEV